MEALLNQFDHPNDFLLDAIVFPSSPICSDELNYAENYFSPFYQLPESSPHINVMTSSSNLGMDLENGKPMNMTTRRRKVTAQSENAREADDVKKQKKSNQKGKDEEEKKVPEGTPNKDYIHVRARRGQATDRHSLAERVRREKISERMKILQSLVPGCDKVTGKAHMLDEIINYVQSLHNQVEFLSTKLAYLDEAMVTNEPKVDNMEIQDVSGLETPFINKQQYNYCNTNYNTARNTNGGYDPHLMDSLTFQPISEGDRQIISGPYYDQRLVCTDVSGLSSNNLFSFH